ncbi:3D domain-containing protein [Marivirga sp. S37H4]|uniref:3D domain-containing protein n=1 Tax=Marivirga aurantiaca TaxID=2802615 RepID=A0A934WZ26_9BACT|nr:3D domain-containing protein [Marivirga aurantiaca]MBK6265455.1 3D domain-containing protein [Marivirga aurantiaca]
MRYFFNSYLVCMNLSLVLTSGCGVGEDQNARQTYDTLKVVATAYNSLEAQTTRGNAAIAAWGDTLKPGMKVIAISRDLIDSGLAHNTEVLIEGLDGTYIVKDKMNRRWTNKIDIYMGEDVTEARDWGRQKVEIYVPVEDE